MQNKAHALATSFRIIIFSLLTIGISACSFPNVYKINVQQGNIVTEDMLGKLRAGMTKSQVHFVLGTPIVTNVFNDNYESYHYSYLPADGEPTQQTINVFYEKDLYTHYEGEVLDEHPAY